jgi:hypothetical protein
VDAAAIVREYYRLFNERQLDEAARFVDPQASFHYVPTRQRLLGRAGYRALAAAWLIAFEDALLEITRVEALDAETVRVHFVGRGTHTGPLMLGEQTSIPPTGRRADLEFTDTLTLRGGSVVKSELNFSLEDLLERLGLAGR